MRIEREAVRHVPDSLSFDSCRPRSGLPPSRQVPFLKACRASSYGLSERAETTGHRAFRSKTQAAKSQVRNAIPPLRATVPARRFNFVPGPSVPAGNDDCTAIRQSEPSRQAGAKPNIGSASANRETGEKRLRQTDLARRLPGREADERNSGVLPPPERSLLRKHRAVRRIGRFGSAACCRRNFPRAHRIDCPRFSLSLRAAARITPIRPVRTHRGRFSFASFLLIGPRII